jgi:hypothetical protein
MERHMLNYNLLNYEINFCFIFSDDFSFYSSCK